MRMMVVGDLELDLRSTRCLPSSLSRPHYLPPLLPLPSSAIALLPPPTLPNLSSPALSPSRPPSPSPSLPHRETSTSTSPKLPTPPYPTLFSPDVSQPPLFPPSSSSQISKQAELPSQQAERSNPTPSSPTLSARTQVERSDPGES